MRCLTPYAPILFHPKYYLSIPRSITIKSGHYPLAMWLAPSELI